MCLLGDTEMFLAPSATWWTAEEGHLRNDLNKFLRLFMPTVPDFSWHHDDFSMQNVQGVKNLQIFCHEYQATNISIQENYY